MLTDHERTSEFSKAAFRVDDVLVFELAKITHQKTTSVWRRAGGASGIIPFHVASFFKVPSACEDQQEEWRRQASSQQLDQHLPLSTRIYGSRLKTGRLLAVDRRIPRPPDERLAVVRRMALHMGKNLRRTERWLKPACHLRILHLNRPRWWLRCPKVPSLRCLIVTDFQDSTRWEGEKLASGRFLDTLCRNNPQLVTLSIQGSFMLPKKGLRAMTGLRSLQLTPIGPFLNDGLSGLTQLQSLALRADFHDVRTLPLHTLRLRSLALGLVTVETLVLVSEQLPDLEELEVRVIATLGEFQSRVCVLTVAGLKCHLPESLEKWPRLRKIVLVDHWSSGSGQKSVGGVPVEYRYSQAVHVAAFVDDDDDYYDFDDDDDRYGCRSPWSQD